jgi:hypothetical protein
MNSIRIGPSDGTEVVAAKRLNGAISIKKRKNSFLLLLLMKDSKKLFIFKFVARDN